jgi:hypothetical protein
MNGAQWYYAQIRWAVMVDGKEGLRHWEEAVHIFLSENRETAFQRALDIGHQAERSHDEGRRWVESKLAQIVRLDCLGVNPTEFQVGLGTSKAEEHLPFEYMFDPEQRADVAILGGGGRRFLPVVAQLQSPYGLLPSGPQPEEGGKSNSLVVN